VALGGGALLALNGMGSKAPTQATPPGTPPGQDPSFNQHLQQMNFNYDPNNIAKDYAGNLNTYALGQGGSGAVQRINPVTGQLEYQQQQGPVGEYNFFNNPDLNNSKTGSAYTKAAGGGSIPHFAMGGLSQYLGYASGGMPDVGTDHGYLQGPGDGVSDDVPAMIGDKQPARLAGGEFIVPARVVSELGNGSSDAGAKRLHEMMMKVDKIRRKGDYARDSKAYKELPA
jgi:hypothetical protein